MNQDMMMLVEKGKMKTVNPEKMDFNDVLTYIGFQKSKGLKESAISHNLSALKNLLAFVGNPAVEMYKVRYPQTVPKRRQGRYPPMEEHDLSKIVIASKRIDSNDWKRLQSYAIVLLSVSAGLRTKELRLSRVDDLNTDTWMFHAERVKGEATYGQVRDIPIRPEARNVLTRYLKLRNRLVAESYSGNLALFPALGDKGDGYYATNSIQKLKALVEQELDIKFDLRKCRRTFGQMALDEGLTIESVSVLMGHSTTKTTEMNYCRRKQDMAIREAQQLWDGQKEADSLPVTKPPRLNPDMG